APNGVMEADRTEGNGSACGNRHRNAQNPAGGMPYTWSVYGQPNGVRLTYFELAGTPAGAGPFPAQVFGQLDTALITKTDEFKLAGMDRAGANWTRFWGTQVANPTVTGNTDTRGPGIGTATGTPTQPGFAIY